MRLLLLTLLLSGCARWDVEPSAQSRALAELEPPYRKLVSGGLVQIVGKTASAQGMQISRLRRVDSIRGPAWLVCLRTRADAAVRDYAVFIQEERIVDSRLAVRADRCDEQAFEAFGVYTDSQNAIR